MRVHEIGGVIFFSDRSNITDSKRFIEFVEKAVDNAPAENRRHVGFLLIVDVVPTHIRLNPIQNHHLRVERAACWKNRMNTNIGDKSESTEFGFDPIRLR